MVIASAEPRKAQLDQIFSHLGGALDIPADLRTEAVSVYERVGAQLAGPASNLVHLSPAISPQGSFRLGTMIRPVTPGCEYDVDLVCVLFLLKEATTQAKLKRISSETNSPDGTKRFWTRDGAVGPCSSTASSTWTCCPASRTWNEAARPFSSPTRISDSGSTVTRALMPCGSRAGWRL